MGVGKCVFIERKQGKYQFDPMCEAFSIIQEQESDKFCFFGSVVGKSNKLYCVKLDLLPAKMKSQILVNQLKYWPRVKKNCHTLMKLRQKPRCWMSSVEQ
jgi:hypothetical protein